MPSFLPENNVTQPGDDGLRSLWKIVGALESGMPAVPGGTPDNARVTDDGGVRVTDDGGTRVVSP